VGARGRPGGGRGAAGPMRGGGDVSYPEIG